MTPQTDLTALQAERIILEWGDAVAAIQSAPGAPDYVDVGRAIAMGDLMADALRAALAGAETPQGMEGEAAQAYGYLSRLLTHCAPQCQPLPDLMGLCSQIDNLIAGLAAAPPPAVAPAALVALHAAAQEKYRIWQDAIAQGKHRVRGLEADYRFARNALLAWTPDAATPPVAAPYTLRCDVCGFTRPATGDTHVCAPRLGERARRPARHGADGRMPEL